MQSLMNRKYTIVTQPGSLAAVVAVGSAVAVIQEQG